MFEIWGVKIYPIAILLAMLLNIVIGMAWYSPVLFGKTWAKLMGKKLEDLKMKPKDIVISIFVAYLLAVGLNSVLQFSAKASGLNEIANIFAASFMIAGTFVLAPHLNQMIFEGKKFGVVVINTLYYLVSLLAMSAVISIWI